VLVAPYAPSFFGQDGESEDLEVERLDNHYLYLIDTKKPSKITRADLKTCYFPSRVLYDAESRTVFVRGTEFYGERESIDAAREVIVHLHLNLDEDGKPLFDPDPPVSIPIKGYDTEFSEDAPAEFVLGHKGKILVYTNGKSIFTYNVITGDLYPVHFEDEVRFLDINQETNTLFIAITREERQEDGQVLYTSELRFSRLREDGTVDLIKHVRDRSDGLPVGLIPGSNAAIVSSLDPDSGENRADFAFYVDVDGSLCQVDLRGSGSDALAEPVGYYTDLAQGDSINPSARKITYNRDKRTLSILKRGFGWEIKRPTFNRPGRIKRPTFLRGRESAAVIIIQLNKKNRIIREKAFTDTFAESGGLSDLVFEGDEVFVAGFDGQLYRIDLTNGVESGSPSSIGKIGERVEFLSRSVSSPVFVAINSFEPDEEGGVMAKPGWLAIARLNSGGSRLTGGMVRTLFHSETLAAVLVKPLGLSD
jgi:hypothetical protein